jgi:hypothetical protein
MATMPSRAGTAPRAIASILRQVSRLWLFLDRFEEVPTFAHDGRIQVLRSQDVGDLRASGKLLPVALEDGPCTFFPVDDDIEYPPDFCSRLESWQSRFEPPVVVGLHAAILRSPLSSFARDVEMLHSRAPRDRAEQVDLLGTASLALDTSLLRFDVREWRDRNMVDLTFALAARRREVPLVMIPRRAHWMKALEENQDDSIWIGLLRDDRRQTELARELASLPRPPLRPRRIVWPRLWHASEKSS